MGSQGKKTFWLLPFSHKIFAIFKPISCFSHILMRFFKWLLTISSEILIKSLKHVLLIIPYFTVVFYLKNTLKTFQSFKIFQLSIQFYVFINANASSMQISYFFLHYPNYLRPNGSTFLNGAFQAVSYSKNTNINIFFLKY